MAIHANWIIDENKKGYFTLGGDPIWCCSNCGGGSHVFGVESTESQSKICKDCGAIMDNAIEVEWS